MKLDLEIERLALPTSNPYAGPRLSQALERELERLVDRYGLPVDKDLGELSIDSASFEVTPGAGPVEMGTQIAHQLFAGLYRNATGRVPENLRDVGRRIRD